MLTLQAQAARELDIDFFGQKRYRPMPDHRLSLQAPVLKRLLVYWRGKAEFGPPGRKDIDPIEIGADVPHLFLLDVRTDPLRFRWRLLGGVIVEATGRNVTGQRFEEVYPHPVLADVMRVFSRATLTGLPIRHVGNARFVDKEHVIYESVHLPLFGADGKVDMLLGALHFGPAERRA